MSIKRIQGNSFFVAHDATMNVLHYGYNEISTDTGQDTFLTFDYLGWKNFLETHGVTLTDKERVEYSGLTVNNPLPSVEVLELRFVESGRPFTAGTPETITHNLNNKTVMVQLNDSGGQSALVL